MIRLARRSDVGDFPLQLLDTFVDGEQWQTVNPRATGLSGVHLANQVRQNAPSHWRWLLEDADFGTWAAIAFRAVPKLD